MIERTQLILLAAGNASRMGKPKALLDFKGVPWVREQLRRFYASGGKSVSLILGSNANEISSKVSFSQDATILMNPHAERGPFSSLQIGINFGIKDSSLTGFFVLPIDTPSDAEVYLALSNYVSDSLVNGNRFSAVQPFHLTQEGLRLGHPVWISLEFARYLSKLDPTLPDSRLDYQLRKLGASRLGKLKVDSRFPISANFNYPSDWEAWVSLNDDSNQQAPQINS